MKNIRNLIKTACIAVTLLCNIGVARPDQAQPVTNAPVLPPAVEAHLQQRKQLIETLIQTVETSVENPSRVQETKAAMLSLGELKAVEAIPVLVKNLFFLPPPESPIVLRSSSPSVGYPAVGALVKIGIPSLDPILDLIKKSSDPEVSDKAYFLFLEVLKSRSIVAAYIKEYREENFLNEDAKLRLDEFQDLFPK